MSPFFLAQLALSSLPSADPIADSGTCYSIARMRDGESQSIGVAWQDVRHVQRDGAKVLEVVVHQRGAGGRFDMRDAFVLDEGTLQPIEFENSRRGQVHVALRYGPGSAEGYRIDEGVTRPIKVDLPEPIWEGNLFGVTVAGLPLAEGATFHLPTFQYDKGIAAFEITVTGSEVVATPEGPVDA